MRTSPVAVSKAKLGCEEGGWQETVGGETSREEKVRRREKEC